MKTYSTSSKRVEEYSKYDKRYGILSHLTQLPWNYMIFKLNSSNFSLASSRCSIWPCMAMPHTLNRPRCRWNTELAMDHRQHRPSTVHHKAR